MNPISTELIETEDGSLSLLDPETGELYHNRAGAITEAYRNYLEPSGADRLLAESGVVRVLDACFGLGYNTWVLVVCLAIELGLSGKVEIVAIERDPQILTIVPAILRNPRLSVLEKALAGPLAIGTTRMTITPALDVTLDIKMGDLRQLVPELTGDFDLVFHDPFSPKRAPELWTVELFHQYRRLLDCRKGKVLTYSSASAVRGGFLEAGFLMGRSAAVGGKSGGTVAWVEGAKLSDTHVFPLSERELSKVATLSGIPYRDPSFADQRKDILKRREREQSTRA